MRNNRNVEEGFMLRFLFCFNFLKNHYNKKCL